MKNLYRVTRPAWAALERAETALIFGVSVAVGLYGGWGQQFSEFLPARIQNLWPLIDLAIITGGCLLLLHGYKRLRIGCYPSTFIYCFDLPEASNPSGKSQVIGYCHLRPDMGNGEIIAEGASLFWENGRMDPDSLVGFTSTLVHAVKDKEETTCNIKFDINAGDSAKRFYRHGLLEFQLVPSGDSNDAPDSYAGFLQSTNRKNGELEDVEVRAKGYAELYKKGPLVPKELQTALSEKGPLLAARLNALLNLRPQPTLWKKKMSIPIAKTNIWGHQIPTPQSVIRDEELYPYIDKFLTKVLSLNGLKPKAIEKFKKLAVATANQEQDELLVAYERDLKAGLIGQIVPDKQDDALDARAQIIFDQISPFFQGESLLDIGCGNGLVANLAKRHFHKIQVLDVVKYVPNALGLHFVLYTEGQPLPVKESFDTVLLLTVLHHSSDPVELLKMAWGVTKKRLIIIESVVGVGQPPPGVPYELARLSDRQQIAYAAFIDWFYNRVLHTNVPVPYNFTTPEKWQSVFVQHGMHLINTSHFGQDIELGPEYHIMFVLEKS